jgi:hypothetical protein
VLMAYQVVRLWWRLNRRRVKKGWQWVKESSVATPPEVTEGLSALLPWGPAGNSPDQLGGETVGRGEKQTREKETVCDAGLCVSEPGVCLFRT